MPDIEITLAAALAAQARAAAAPARTASVRFDVDVLAGPVGRRRTARRPLAIGGSILATAAAIVAVVAAGSVHAAHGPAPHTAAAGPAAAAPAAATTTYLKVSLASGPVTQTYWVPRDPSAIWRLTVVQPGVPTIDQTAACGAFASVASPPPGGSTTPAAAPGCSDGSWEFPRPAFLAALPTDPAAVRAGLLAHAGGLAVLAFQDGVGVLSTGTVPDAIAQRIETALRGISGVTVRAGVTDTKGRHGTELTMRLHKGQQPAYDAGLLVDTTGRVLDLVDTSAADRFSPLTYSTTATLT